MGQTEGHADPIVLIVQTQRAGDDGRGLLDRGRRAPREHAEVFQRNFFGH